jgi:glycosyltransferase involved in cell wall biosynthesis
MTPPNTSMPTVTVVLPTFNRAAMLRGALQSLLHQRTDGLFSYEVVVVDNDSTDETKAVVQEIAAISATPVRYLFDPIHGVASARNKAIRETQGDWLAFFDDDETALDNWLIELYQVAVEKAAACVGGAVYLDVSEEELARLGPLGREALREAKFDGQVRKYCRKENPGSGNMLVSRRVFETIGLFDCDLLRGGSDYDFAIRMRRAGVSMWFTPHAIIMHKFSAGRVTEKSFRCDGLRSGASLAFFDHRYKGTAAMICLGLARLAQAALVHVPALAIAWVRGDSGGVLGRRCRLWRCQGYYIQELCLLAPRWFGEEKLLKALEFRAKVAMEQTPLEECSSK